MRGVINIGDKSVEMVANGATPFLYKRVFRRDFLSATQKEDDLDVYTELGFIMAMQAEKPTSELINSLSIDDFYEWVVNFEAMDMVNHVTEIFELYQAQSFTTSKSKKK